MNSINDLKDPPIFPCDISENCRDFLYEVLKFQPEDRPNAIKLMEHPFIKDSIYFILNIACIKKIIKGELLIMDMSSKTTSKFDFNESTTKFKKNKPFVSNNSKVTLSCIDIQRLTASYKYFPNKLPSLTNLQSYNFAKDGFQSGTFNKNSFEKPNLSLFSPFSFFLSHNLFS